MIVKNLAKNLRRNMLYPFMSVREDGGEVEERDLVNPPFKSMSYNATVLQEANLEMVSHFESK